MNRKKWTLLAFVLLLGSGITNRCIFEAELKQSCIGMLNMRVAQVNLLTNEVLFHYNMYLSYGEVNSLNEIYGPIFYNLSKKHLDLYGMMVPYTFEMFPSIPRAGYQGCCGRQPRVIGSNSHIFADMFNLYFDLKDYILYKGVSPTSTEELLQPLVKKHETGKWPDAILRTQHGRIINGRYPLLSRSDLMDPWGREYKFRCPGQKGDCDVFTYGADGALGGNGPDRDIFIWQYEGPTEYCFKK